MSLATRCPACGTIFRVVQDQLKVSEGWVRCGQCHEVFHGIEALFDLDSDPAIVARRAARGGTASPPAPSTRVFAENRANASIPTPGPPAGVVVHAPPPASASASASTSTPAAPTRMLAQAPVPMAPPATSRPPEPRPIPPAGVAAGSHGGTDPLGADAPAPRAVQAGVTRGTIAPRFAARLAEDSARAQAGVPPDASPGPGVRPGPVTGPLASPLPSAFPQPDAPAAESVPDLGSWSSTDETAPPEYDNAPDSAFEPSAWQPPPPAAVPPQAPWSMPSAWQPSSPETAAVPSPASNSGAWPPPPASPRAAWRSPPGPAEPAPSIWPAAGSPIAPVPSAWTPAVPPQAPPDAPSHAPTPAPATPSENAWQPAPPRPIAPAWQPPAAVPAAPPPTIWETPADMPASARPSFTAPTEAMPLDERPPIAPSSFQPSAFGHDSSSFAPASLDAPPAAKLATELAEDVAAAPRPVPARQPRTIMPKPAAGAVVRPAAPRATRSRDIGGSTLPSLLADDDAADEDARAGPPTLASMLPEDAGEWPPRRKGRTLREPKVASASDEAKLESELASSHRNDPRFLREARSDARWSRPWVRAVLGVSLGVLVVAAVAQVAWPQRDLLAARWPATLPAWNWLCAQADCRIEPPRAVASLALDGSALNRTDTEHVLLFSADLHNRADHAVRMPSFDLTFMDINGAIVSRKVLSPEQIGIHQAALGADAELHVHVRLQVGTLDASGFQAEMFYP